MSQTKDQAPDVPQLDFHCHSVSDALRIQLQNAVKSETEAMLKRVIGDNHLVLKSKDRSYEPGHTWAARSQEATCRAFSSLVPTKPADKIRQSAAFFAALRNAKVASDAVNTKLSFFTYGPNRRWKYATPNLVALNRLFSPFVVTKQIDTYYTVHTGVFVFSDGSYEVTANFIDMLEYPQFIVGNAGPGQSMTNQAKLYRSPPGLRPLTSRRQKEAAIMQLRFTCSTSHWHCRRRQSLIDNIEVALAGLGIPNVPDLQKLRRSAVKEERFATREEWAQLKRLNDEHKFIFSLPDVEERTLFKRYV